MDPDRISAIMVELSKAKKEGININALLKALMEPDEKDEKDKEKGEKQCQRKIKVV